VIPFVRAARTLRGGTPLRRQMQGLERDRAPAWARTPSGPFNGFNRPGAASSDAIIQNWWRQGMMGGAKAHYDGIVAFSQTDFTEDLKKSTVPSGETTTAGTIHNIVGNIAFFCFPIAAILLSLRMGKKRAVAIFPAPRSCVVNCGRANRHIDDSRL
jgi:hypothetical protein